LRNEGSRISPTGDVDDGADRGRETAEIAVLDDPVDWVSQVSAPIGSGGIDSGARDELVREGGSGNLIELVDHCEKVAGSIVCDCVIANSINQGVPYRVTNSCRACSGHRLTASRKQCKLIVVQLNVFGEHSRCFLN
jgi:hypothetical protein